MTRAEQLLILTESGGRNFDGSPRYPSRFILDIDRDAVTYLNEPEEGLIKSTREYVAIRSRFYTDSADHFAPGTRIRHTVFGEGVILETDTKAGTYKIRFDKMDTDRSISFRVQLEAL